MSASFPSAVKTFTARSNGQTIDAAHVGDLQDEVHALEDGLLNASADLVLGSTLTIGSIRYKWPTSAPTAAQVLTISSTSGSTNVLAWSAGSGADPAYTATVADVANTNSITTTLSFTLGNAMADGDQVEIQPFVLLKNNKGSAGTVTQTFVFGGVTQVLTAGAATWSDNATERGYNLRYVLTRQGTDAYLSWQTLNASVDDMNTVNGTQKITAPSFASGQTFALRITLNATDASFYWKTKSARVRHKQ